MGTYNIRLYKEADKKYTGCNLKTKELLDCVPIGVCVVIRLNMVFLQNISLSGYQTNKINANKNQGPGVQSLVS